MLLPLLTVIVYLQISTYPHPYLSKKGSKENQREKEGGYLGCLTASDNFPFTTFRVSSGTSQFSEKGAAPVSLRSSMQWHLNFRTGASVNSMMLAPQRQEERVMISISGWIC
jgi:hypothetical protein